MKMSVCKIFRFDAAHLLPEYEGKCRNLHGHTWTLEVEVTGNVDPRSGMIADFAEVKDIVNRYVINILDHSFLNKTVPNPTAENILTWILGTLSSVRGLKRLRLYETPDSFAELKID